MLGKQVVAIAGPSGSGKSTIIREITGRFSNCAKLVTATTRSPRSGEEDGIDHYFFSTEKFDEEQGLGNIPETRFVVRADTHYGIYLPELKRLVAKGKIIFADVDVSGARYLKENYGATAIFIMPESLQQFRARVRRRNPDMPKMEFEERMKITEEEMHVHAPQFDHSVVNGDGALAETVDNIVGILRREGYAL